MHAEKYTDTKHISLKALIDSQTSRKMLFHAQILYNHEWALSHLKHIHAEHIRESIKIAKPIRFTCTHITYNPLDTHTKVFTNNTQICTHP